MKCFEDLSGPELAAPHTFIQQANTGSTCGSALVVKTAKFSADCALSTCVLMPSACEVAKRDLVRLLRKLGKQYGVSVVTNLRESPPHDVNRCYRSVARKAHPDKPGGCKSDFQELSAAHDAWTDLHKAERPVGRPKKQHVKCKPLCHKPDSQYALVPVPLQQPEHRDGFRIQARAVLFTYQGFVADTREAAQIWENFVLFIKSNKKEWGVKHWTATLEANQDGRHHTHLMVDFFKAIDRTARYFSFDGRCPNASPNDLLGDGWSRSKHWQTSVDRGHFYVWANKKGTARDSKGCLCVAANYEPAWTAAKETYVVKAAWPEKLWRAYKLDDGVYYNEYLFLCKDNVAAKKRNFETYRAWQRGEALDQDIEDRTKRIRSMPDLYEPFAEVALAQEFLALFKNEALRYPVLLAHAPSYAGKSEWAVSLFKKPLYLEIGSLGLWPPGMKKLDRSVHDGLVLDDLRDLRFLHENQEKLQGKYNRPVTLFTTPGGDLACTVDLYRLPIIFTINNSTLNLDLLATHDFCSKRENVRLLSFRGRPGQSMVTESLPEEDEEGEPTQGAGSEPPASWDPYL